MPRVIAFAVVIAVALALWLHHAPHRHRQGDPRGRQGEARRAAVGIDVEHIFAVTFGIGIACLALAACLLLPTYYVNPHAGNAFVLVAFTIVVLGGMGCFAGALVGGLIIGVIESSAACSSASRSARSASSPIFILVLLFRPTGLFGERA